MEAQFKKWKALQGASQTAPLSGPDAILKQPALVLAQRLQDVVVLPYQLLHAAAPNQQPLTLRKQLCSYARNAQPQPLKQVSLHDRQNAEGKRCTGKQEQASPPGREDIATAGLLCCSFQVQPIRQLPELPARCTAPPPALLPAHPC